MHTNSNRLSIKYERCHELFMDWLKDHIAEIVLGVAGLAGAGSLIALANDIASIVTSKPYAVMAIAFFGVVVGVLICYLSELKEYRVEKLRLEHQDQEEERKKKEEQDEEKRERKREIEQSINDFKQEKRGKKKAMAACIYKLPNHCTKVNEQGKQEIEAMDRNYNMSYSWYPYFIFDSREDFYNVELEDWLVDMFDANPDIVEDFTAEIKNECNTLINSWDPF